MDDIENVVETYEFASGDAKNGGADLLKNAKTQQIVHFFHLFSIIIVIISSKTLTHRNIGNDNIKL